MDYIKIQGGQIHITQDNMTVYQVMEGHVLVYLFPYTNGIPGRRQLIAEMTPGEKIPAFTKDDEVLGVWRIGLVALDKAVIKVCDEKQNEEIKNTFALKVQIKLFDIQEYDEQLIEKYNINIIKEEGYIYATAREQKNTYEKSLNIIYGLFQRKKENRVISQSGNRIYDGVAYLCNKSDIQIASLDKIQDSCGRRFTVADIARISHFIVREVVLEPKWYKRDSGPILTYRKDGHQPIACVPISPKKYMAYDAQRQTSCIIDEEYAQQLEVKADMLYRPFPNKELKAKDLFFFGMKNVYKSDIVRFILLALLGTLIGLLIPFINEQLYDKFIPMGNKTGLVQISCVILACTIGNVTFTIVKNLAAFRSMNAMEYAVQSATYDRLFNLPESFFRKYDSAELAQRAMGISQIYNTIADVAIKTILSAVFSLLYLWRMFQYSKKLTSVSLVMLLICMLVIVWIGILQTKYEVKKMELDSKTSSVMYQFLNGISKIRIAGVENRALYEYLKTYTKSRKINIRKEKMTVAVNTLVGAMNTVFSIVLYYLMIKNSMKLSVGAFMGFSAAFGSFSGAMLQIVSSILQVNDIKPAYDRCKPILQTLSEFDEDMVMPGTLTGDIEVNNLTFSYNEASGVILNDVSMHIKAGEYIGIVGSSGSGKSTLLKLLLGFEKPDVGKIYYDGKDIDSMDKRELRKKFGVVLQDGKLISGSIFENITITAPGTKLEQVKKVVKAVGLEDDINQMPMGLHTVLSEDSGTISGGQQQRILIVRAIVGNPKIIYFDEATSALDNVTQAMVCESLERLKATRVVIAHRLSTVMNCDRIFVLEKGTVVEQGSYKELMDKKGRFYDLAVRQL